MSDELNAQLIRARDAHVPVCSSDSLRSMIERFPWDSALVVSWGIHPPDANPPDIPGEVWWRVGCDYGDKERSYGATLTDAIREFITDHGRGGSR